MPGHVELQRAQSIQRLLLARSGLVAIAVMLFALAMAIAIALSGKTAEERREQITQRIAQLESRLSVLHAQRYEQMSAAEVLNRSSAPELENVRYVLQAPLGSRGIQLEKAVRRAGSHSARSVLGRDSVEYLEVAQDAAREAGAVETGTIAIDAERALVASVFNQLVAKMPETDRRRILAELGAQNWHVAGVAGVSAALVVANLSGFALYTAASTSLAAVAGAAGVTLPFVVYTTMSSALSVLTGPFGWAALGGLLIYKLGGPNYMKTIPAVLAIAAIRARLAAERDSQISSIRYELDALKRQALLIAR